MFRSAVKILALVAFFFQPSNAILRYFSQRLDHFNLDRTMWDQYYEVNDAYFITQGPIFIHVSQEVPYDKYLQSGEILSFTKQLNGIIFGLAHRFYGPSRPTEEYNLANLKYMTQDQAINDIAYFIDVIKATYSGTERSKVILFGEGYGAVIAARTRQLYPHLVDGVWASSAYMTPVLDNARSTEDVGLLFKRIGGDACYQTVRDAFDNLDVLIWHEYDEAIQEYFRLCKPLNTQNSTAVAVFVSSLVHLLIEYFQTGSYTNVEDACMIIADKAQSEMALDAFAYWLVDVTYKDVPCFDFDLDDAIEYLKREEYDDTGVRQTEYYRCTQLGHIVTSDLDDTFTNLFPIEEMEKFCMLAFGDLGNFTYLAEHVSYTIRKYGYLGINAETNRIISTDADLDPMHNLGVLFEMNPQSPAIYMPMQAKADDLVVSTANDYPILVDTRLRIRAWLLRWIFDMNSIEEAEEMAKKLFKK